MNKVILVGNLTRNIEMRYSGNGTAFAKSGIAVNRKWRDKNTGEDKNDVTFVDIVIIGKSAEVANQYLSKGKKVLMEGRLQLESWESDDGQRRSKHSVFVESFEFLDSKESNGEINSGQQRQDTIQNKWNQNSGQQRQDTIQNKWNQLSNGETNNHDFVDGIPF